MKMEYDILMDNFNKIKEFRRLGYEYTFNNNDDVYVYTYNGVIISVTRAIYKGDYTYDRLSEVRREEFINVCSSHQRELKINSIIDGYKYTAE